ncbi:MAG: UDP-glucose 4-epimerase GalE, partial [Alphaproteobacteria bacterium]
NARARFSWLPEDVPVVRADVADRAALEMIADRHHPRAVIHLAALIDAAESVARPLAYYRENVLGTLVLAEWMQAHRVPFLVYSSSAAVYGTGHRPPVGEDAPLRPANPYGETKRVGEDLLAGAARASGGGLAVVALRYFNVAGADPEGRTGPQSGRGDVISAACRAALAGEPFCIFGTDWPTADGTPVRDFIHVADLADMHLAALAWQLAGRQKEPFSVFNCGYGRGVSVREVVDAAMRAAGRSFEVQAAPRRVGDIGEMVADPSRFAATIGHVPRHAALDAIVASHLRWLAEGREGTHA